MIKWAYYYYYYYYCLLDFLWYKHLMMQVFWIPS